MSKKDYIKMARAFRNIWHDRDFENQNNETLFYEMVSALANVCQEDNPMFNRGIFFSAIMDKDAQRAQSAQGA